MQTAANAQVVWFTGLSGAGKSTLCASVAHQLSECGVPTQVLDGDELRTTLCQDLTFSDEDRLENVRRISFVASLLSKHGITVLVAAISPRSTMRELAKSRCTRYIEVFVDAPLHICEQRDTKGLYRRARAGEIQQFTGIDSPYERPSSPDIICYTATESILESTAKVLQRLLHNHSSADPP